MKRQHLADELLLSCLATSFWTHHISKDKNEERPGRTWLPTYLTQHQLPSIPFSIYSNLAPARQLRTVVSLKESRVQNVRVNIHYPCQLPELLSKPSSPNKVVLVRPRYQGPAKTLDSKKDSGLVIRKLILFRDRVRTRRETLSSLPNR